MVLSSKRPLDSASHFGTQNFSKKTCTYYIEIGLSLEVAFDKHALNNAKVYLTLHTWSIRASAHEVLIQAAK